MGTIEKRVSRRGKTYRARVRIRGRNLSETFGTRTEARQWIASTEHAVRTNRLFGRGRNRTLAELVERYCLSPGWQALSQNDQRNREAQLDWWLAWTGPQLRVEELTRADILDYLDALSVGETRSGRPLAPATRNRNLAAISAALSYAVEREWLPFNPALGISRLREAPRVRFLTRLEDVTQGEEPELLRFLAACRRSSDPRLYPSVLIMLSTGCRRSDLYESRTGTHTTAARWRDVTILCPDGTARIQIHRAKSGRAKVLVLTGATASALRDYAQVRPLNRDAYLFEREGVCRWPRREFEGALQRAGIEDFRPHDLCHSAISYMVMAGRSLAEVAEATDRTYSMVQRYAHLSPSHAAAVVGSAQTFLDSAAG